MQRRSLARLLRRQARRSSLRRDETRSAKRHEPFEANARTNHRQYARIARWAERISRTVARSVHDQRGYIFHAEGAALGPGDWVFLAAGSIHAARAVCGNCYRRDSEFPRDSESGDGPLLGHHAAWNAAGIDCGIRDAEVWKASRSLCSAMKP